MGICSKCASFRITCCCQERDILLTQGDLERIRQVLGHTDFFEYRKPIDQAYLDQSDDPNWLLYTVRADGTRRVLKRASTRGTCQFLTKTGCLLDMDTRPLVCRLYPFHYTEQGITGILSECPEHLLEQGQTIIQALGMSYEKAKDWRTLLYTELRMGRECADEHRTHL